MLFDIVHKVSLCFTSFIPSSYWLFLGLPNKSKFCLFNSRMLTSIRVPLYLHLCFGIALYFGILSCCHANGHGCLKEGQNYLTGEGDSCTPIDKKFLNIFKLQLNNYNNSKYLLHLNPHEKYSDPGFLQFKNSLAYL